VWEGGEKLDLNLAFSRYGDVREWRETIGEEGKKRRDILLAIQILRKKSFAGYVKPRGLKPRGKRGKKGWEYHLPRSG